jgi:hypothetical protein
LFLGGGVVSGTLWKSRRDEENEGKGRGREVERRGGRMRRGKPYDGSTLCEGGVAADEAWSLLVERHGMIVGVRGR